MAKTIIYALFTIFKVSSFFESKLVCSEAA